MKRINGKSVILMILSCAVSLPMMAQFAGAGTAENPYIISSADDLAKLSSNVSDLDSTYCDRYFKLVADVNLSGDWKPIGSYDRAAHQHAFMGVFDGDGHRVSGVSINDEFASYAGLFGIISGATVKNLVVSDVNVNVLDYAGAAVGAATHKSVIENVIVKSSNIQAERSAAGVVGLLTDKSVVRSCKSEANVSGSINIGGIVGWAERSSEVSCCENFGSVTADKTNVGGVAGRVSNDAVVKASANSGAVNKGQNAGGVVGYADNAQFAQVVNTGSVSSESGYAGGVVGYARRSKVSDAVTASAVYSSANTECAGGIAGYAANRSKFNNALSNSTVSGSKYTGNVIGYKRVAKLSGVYFDKQMTSASSVIGNRKPKEKTDTLAKFTRELIGDGLKPTYGDSLWVYQSANYPTAVSECIEGIAKVASTPIIFENGDQGNVNDVQTEAKMQPVEGYTYTSNGSSVWFSPDGTMQRIGSGIDTIKVVDGEGHVVRTIPLNVTKFDGIRIINEDDCTLAAGTDTTFTQRENLPVGTWASSDAEVATVSETGDIHPIKSGNFMITCTLPNGTSDSRNISVTQIIAQDDTTFAHAQYLAEHVVAHFRFNNISNPSMSKEELEAYNELIDILKEHKDIKLQLVGHTCNIGSNAVNKRVGERRANVVKAKIVKQGVDAQQVSVSSAGKSKPVQSNSTAKGRSANRRVEFKAVQ